MQLCALDVNGPPGKVRRNEDGKWLDSPRTVWVVGTGLSRRGGGASRACQHVPCCCCSLLLLTCCWNHRLRQPKEKRECPQTVHGARRKYSKEASSFPKQGLVEPCSNCGPAGGQNKHVWFEKRVPTSAGRDASKALPYLGSSWKKRDGRENTSTQGTMSGSGPTHVHFQTSVVSSAQKMHWTPQSACFVHHPDQDTKGVSLVASTYIGALPICPQHTSAALVFLAD